MRVLTHSVGLAAPTTRTTAAERAGLARHARDRKRLVEIGVWRGLIDTAGIVALHDSRSTPDRAIADAGSVIYTREVIAADRRFELIDAVDSLTVLRRLPETRRA